MISEVIIHKPLVRKYKKQKIYSSFKDDIWDADYGDMQLISKFNKGFRFLLCSIEIYSNYTWVIRLKDKKDIKITNAFHKFLDESGLKTKQNMCR